MKFKIGLLSLLVMGLCLGFAFNAGAAITFTRMADVNDPGSPGASKVIGAITATEGAASTTTAITWFNVVNNAGATGTGAQLDSIKVYEDVNANGLLDFNDTWVAAAAASANYDAAGAGVQITPPATLSVTNGTPKNFLIVAQYKKAGVTDGTTFGALVSGNSGLGAIAADGVNLQTARAVNVVATHLRFNTAGYNPQVATGGQILVTGQTLLTAVDDYGNTDTGFVEGIQFSAVSYNDLSVALNTNLTANMNGAASVKTGAGNVPMTLGVLANDTTGAAANTMMSLLSTDAGPVTIVAQSATSKLEGSVTICNQAYNAIVGVQSTRGIEVYDIDHNGHIDHATIFFNAPVAVGAGTINAFTAVGYSLAAAVVSNFDAGGTGIRNAGEYGVTITLPEAAAFNTNSKPDITYTASAGTLVDKASAAPVPSIVSAAAIEVDKARPILLSIMTNDTDGDGMVDGVKLLFSEPVYTLTADAVAYAAGGGPGAKSVALRNTMQGGGETSISFPGTLATALPANELIINVNETIPNTGILPVLLHKEGDPTNSIKDAATAATGANSPNLFWATNTNYSVVSGRSINIADGVSPIISNVTTGDVDADGKIDRLAVTFSEPMNNVIAYAIPGMNGYSAVTGFGSAGGGAGFYLPVAGGAAFNPGLDVITYTITEAGAGIFDTEARPTIYYNPTLGNLRDANGFELAMYGPGGRTVPDAYIIDGAAPVLVKAETGDVLSDTAYGGLSAFESAASNGRLDKLVLEFSERIKTDATAGSAPTAAQLKAILGQFTINHEDMGGAGANGAVYKVSPVSGDTGGYGADLVQYDAKAVPTWADVTSGDTKTTVTVYFFEMPFANLTGGLTTNNGDTGALPTVAYAQGAVANQIKDMNSQPVLMANLAATAAKTVDKAAPFIVKGIGMGYGATAFANIITFDDSSAIAESDSFNGDGYIDSFKLFFSEAVRVLSANAGADSIAPAFTVAVAAGNSAITLNKGVDANLDGAITAADANFTTNNVVVYGTSTKIADKWDTGTTPTLAFNGSAIVYDIAGAAAKYEPGVDNVLAAFAAQPSYDGAAPVIARATGSVASTSILVQYSEPVFTVAGASLAGVAGNTIVMYDDYNSWGAKNVAVAVAAAPTSSSITVTVDSTLVLSDVTSDLIHTMLNVVYDNANSVETGLADNVCNGSNASKPAGLMLTIDDKIAPWITAAITVDADGDGLIDHIRLTLSENIKDATAKGYNGINALGNDIASTWVIPGYSGTVKWNFFQNTTAGKAAAFTAGEPIFTDNGVNDSVLYLRLDEAAVPVSPSGSGSTNFAPVVAFGSGVYMETLSDFKPNVLNTASSDPTAVNGTVTDAVGPIMMSAKYTSTTTLDVTFSEDITLSTVVKGDFNWILGTTGQSPETPVGWQAYTVNITKPSAGVAKLEVIPDKAWTATTTGTLTQVGPVSDVRTPTALGGLVSGAVANASAIFGTSATVFATRTVAANKAITIDIGTPPAGGDSGVGKLALTPVPSTPLAISNKNVTAVAFYGTAAAGDEVAVKFVDTLGTAVTTTVTANAAGNFSGTLDASSLANGMVTVMAGKSVASVVAAWFTGADYLKDTMLVGAPSGLAITDVPNDQGGFVDVTFTKSTNDASANPAGWYEVDYYVLQGKIGSLWYTVQTFPVDGNADTTYRRMGVWVGTETTLTTANFRLNAHTKISTGAAKPAEDAPDVMSSPYVYATGTANDEILPGNFLSYAGDSGAGTGVMLSWTVPANHGKQNYGGFEMWGVDSYDVYRKVSGSTDDYVKVGNSAPGVLTYTDPVAVGVTVYEYMVKAVDGSQMVSTSPMKAMSTKGADFNADGSVGLGDLVLLGQKWGVKNTDAAYVFNYDLNKDNAIGLGDLVLLGNQWGTKTAKSAPSAGVELPMVAGYNPTTSMYYVTVSSKEALEGVAFTLKYDTNAFEFVNDSVTGLGTVSFANEREQGVIDIASVYGNDAFSGAIVLGFKAKARTSDMNLEMLNAEVMLNGVLGSVNGQTVSLKALPTAYTLSQNFPNPFNPTTTIEYSIPAAGHTTLVIYNLAGQKVRTLVNDVQAPAFYKVVWNGKNDSGMTVATGTYFYKLVSGNYSKIVKMILVK